MVKRESHHTREQRAYILDVLNNYNQPLNRAKQPEPQPFKVVKQAMEQAKDEDKELLVVAKDNNAPQSAVVVKIDKIFNRHALCHLVTPDGIEDEPVIPYTINYSMFFDQEAHDTIKLRE
ncbi:hypothetical protein GPK34_00515 [Secundilactobacillus kimchicus]|uniref:hypothetical protein n=1 Tax=Secundilactobacillus kimchicus TaxID=528209 RepID=UPI001C039D4B|nr:hypothetical protein [Secundilactobacillus kimchicus]MBT9670520.1 hypothetical protein [Secundilactobacillus kimchicus]